jgi:hypothetical protein
MFRGFARIFGFGLLAATSFACSSGAAPTGQANAAETVRVMCRSSDGECANSCADHRHTFTDPHPACPGLGDQPFDTGACVCGSTPPPAPTGCVSDPELCENVCRGGAVIVNDPACRHSDTGAHGCYCN